MEIITISLLLSILISIILWFGSLPVYIKSRTINYKNIYNNILALEIGKSKLGLDLDQMLNTLEEKKFYSHIENTDDRMLYIKRDLKDYLKEDKLDFIESLLLLRVKSEYQIFQKRYFIFSQTIVLGILVKDLFDILFSKVLGPNLSSAVILSLVIPIALVPFLKKKVVNKKRDSIKEFLAFVDTNL